MTLEKYLTLFSLPAGAFSAIAAASLALSGGADVELFAALAIIMLSLGSAMGFSWWTKRRQGTSKAAKALHS